MAEKTMPPKLWWTFLVIAGADAFVRLYCAWIISSRHPELYEDLDQPGVFGWPSLSFVYKATRPKHIIRVSTSTRFALRAAQILDLVTVPGMVVWLVVVVFLLHQH